MTDEPRILTDDESYLRRSQQASSVGAGTIAMCARSGCPRAAHWGPFCDDHRQAGPTNVVACDLTLDEIVQIRADVEAKAVPLFLLAMDWLVRGQLANPGVPQLAGPITITRGDA